MPISEFLLASFLLAQTTVSESITVTATRSETRVADTPASVVVLTREALENSAAPTLDDALRQVTGFTLFRRSGSRVANPTSQGVSLRGIGASGASRALVLDDGVPLNDPFGGWIYWGRTPRASLDRVEVLRGGASDLYGSSAMGGVVQFIRRKGDGVTADVSYGAQETGSASLFAGVTRGGWNGSVAADLFTTGGYVLVRPEERGLVDVNADSRHTSIDGTLRRGPAFLRLSHYDETRDNGTPMQVNDTTLRQVATGGELAFAGGVLSLRAHASDQDYYQTFSAVASDRNSERLVVEQNVPSQGAGGSAQYTHAIGGRHVVIGGTDLRFAKGTSEERRFTPNGTFDVEAGGRQRTAAVFVEDLFTLSPSVSLTTGVRFDSWQNEGGGLRHDETSLNPRVALLYRANDSLTLSASAYSAFRAPTLNELYRGFRVGNVNTLPNAGLEAEELTGFEAGARLRNVRLTAFVMSVSNTIANVTIDTNPSVITRRRENLGRTRSIGAELDGDWRLGRDWRASAGLMLVDATIRDGELRGNRLPQVPRQQATVQLAWRSIGVQARWSAMQYDDDRNTLALDSYLVADLFASHPIASGADVTLAVENVFDEQVEVSATPVVTLGQPRAWRIGVRYRR